MADKNWLNLGVAFPVVDKGAKKAIGAMKGSLDKIGGSLDDIGSSNAFEKLMQSVDVRKLDKVVEKMDSLADAAASNINLSSSLDSQYLSASISAEKLGATTNVSAKKIKQATGFFADLQMDVNELQKGFVTLEKAGLDVSKLGFSNFKEFAKFSDVVGVSTESLANELHGLRNSYGFTDDQLAGFLDTMTATSKEMGISREVFGNMSAITQQLDDHFARLNMNVTPEQFTQAAKEAVLLSGALHKTGIASGDVVQTQQGLAQQLTEARFQMRQLATGAAGELPDMLTKMGVASQDFDAAMTALNSSPLDFMTFMSDRFKDMSESQREFFITHSGLSKDLMWSMANYPKVAEEVQRVADKTRNAAGASQEMSKAYRVNRTMQEKFSFANEKFETRLLRMSSKMGIANQILDNQRLAHSKLYETLEAGAKKDGAVGLITQAFLAYKQGGLQGAVIAIDNFLSNSKSLDAFLTKHSKKIEKLKDAFGTLAEKLGFEGSGDGLVSTLKDLRFELMGMAPMVLGVAAAVKMSGLGGAMTSLFAAFGPAGPIALAVGGLAAIDKHWEGGIEGFTKDVVAFAKENIPKAVKKIQGELPTIMKKSGNILGILGTALVEGLNATSEMMDEVNWEKMGAIATEKFAEYSVKAFDFVADVLRVAITGDEVKGDSELQNALGKIGHSIGEAIIGGIKGALGRMGDEIASDTSVTDKLSGAGKILAGSFVGGIGLRGVGSMMQKVPGLRTAGKGVGLAGRGMTAGATGTAKVAAKGAVLAGKGLMRGGKGAWNVGKGVKDVAQMGKTFEGLSGAASKKVGFGARIGAALKGLPGTAGKAFKGIAKAAGPWLKTVGKILGPLIVFYEYIKQGPDIVEGAFGTIKAVIEGDVNDATKYGEKAFKGFARVLDGVLIGIPGKITDALMPDGLVFDLGEFYRHTLDVTEEHIEVMVDEWSAFPETMKGMFGNIGMDIKGIFSDAREAAGEFWEGFMKSGSTVLALMEVSFDAFSHVIIHGFLGKMLRAVEDFIIGLIKPWQELANKPMFSRFVKALPGGKMLQTMDLESFRVTDALGLTDEAARKSREGVAKSAKVVAASGALATPGGGATGALLEAVLGEPIESLAKKSDEQTEELKKVNENLKESRRRSTPPAINQPALD